MATRHRAARSQALCCLAAQLSMKALLSDDLWRELSARAAGHHRIRAAIAYVTAPHLDFRRGDLLICDASDESVKGGLTSASMLRSFASQGAELYSYPGLHSKVAVIGDLALIGSANLSENAGVQTCEASLLTDDLQVVGLVHGLIEKVKSEAEPIIEDFLRRIELLPVTRVGGLRRTSKTKIEIGKSRVWLVSTRELSDRLVEIEEAFEAIGTEEARKHLKDKGYTVESIRWTGKSRFRSEAKQGDLVVEVFTKRRGNRRYTRVYQAAPLIYRQDEGHWTRFYLEVTVKRPSARWRDTKAKFESLGVTNITPSSERELTGKALGILQLMDQG